jgi:uncharacterized protein YndB with AHSA1/START domain
MMQGTKTELASIEKTITVGRPVAEAFRVFTEEIGTWWPLATHARAPERAVTAVIEPRVGGRIYERTRDGEELEWGEVLVWEPPHRLVQSWHLGQPAATEVEVRFVPDGDGTRVELEHRGWARLGAEAAEHRANYDSGWDYVFGERYGTAAG